MVVTMEWISHALRDHPELALFLAMAAGYFIGQLRLGSFKLGAVVGCLLAGVAVGQLGITVAGVLGRTFFLLFLFSVGYKTGPQFFRGLGRNSIPQLILTLIFTVSGLLMTYAVALVLGFNAGTATGLLAGGLHSTEALGTGSDAIGRLDVGEEVRRALTADATAAYALTYMVAIFTAIVMLVRVGPWIMRVNLREECQKLEKELGMKEKEPGVVSAYKQFVMRAYIISEDMDGKTVAELENIFAPERVFIERVRNEQQIISAHPDLRLHAGNIVVLSGRSKILGGSANPLHRYELEDPVLLDIPATAVDHVLQRKDLVNRTLAEIVDTLGGEVATRGVYVSKVMRGTEELPMGSKVVLEPGDRMTLIGPKRHIDRLAATLGPVERTSYATNLISLCLAIGIGGLIGLPALKLTSLHVALGIPVGVLLASFVVGWIQSIRPGFARVPEPVLSLLDSLGLCAFIASIGINAGPSFIYGVRTSGLALLLAGVVVGVVPYLLTILVGYYIFRIHPGLLLGICAGSGTSSPGLAAVQEKAESRVPVLSYGLSYAISALIFALWGSIIVVLVHGN